MTLTWIPGREALSSPLRGTEIARKIGAIVLHEVQVGPGDDFIKHRSRADRRAGRGFADADGRDVNALLALGFKLETMADLVRSELATVRIETVENRDSKIEFAIIQITDAGWRTLEGLTPQRRSPHPPEDQ